MNDNDPLTIPDDWSGQQALAIFDFLDKLRQKMWLEYQEEIIHQLRSEMDKTDLEQQNNESPFEFDDDIDF
jgi:hypothetical protein